MGTTAKGYPYPDPTDAVAAGADTIKALAQGVDANLGVMAAGLVDVNIANAASGAATVTFPVGRFATSPIVTATNENLNYNVTLSGRSATSVTTTVRRNDGSSVTATIRVYWIARTNG